MLPQPLGLSDLKVMSKYVADKYNVTKAKIGIPLSICQCNNEMKVLNMIVHISRYRIIEKRLSSKSKVI